MNITSNLLAALRNADELEDRVAIASAIVETLDLSETERLYLSNDHRMDSLDKVQVIDYIIVPIRLPAQIGCVVARELVDRGVLHLYTFSKETQEVVVWVEQSNLDLAKACIQDALVG